MVGGLFLVALVGQPRDRRALRQRNGKRSWLLNKWGEFLK